MNTRFTSARDLIEYVRYNGIKSVIFKAYGLHIEPKTGKTVRSADVLVFGLLDGKEVVWLSPRLLVIFANYLEPIHSYTDGIGMVAYRLDLETFELDSREGK